jgi:hypothetical protein
MSDFNSANTTYPMTPLPRRTTHVTTKHSLVLMLATITLAMSGASGKKAMLQPSLQDHRVKFALSSALD